MLSICIDLGFLHVCSRVVRKRVETGHLHVGDWGDWEGVVLR